MDDVKLEGKKEVIVLSDTNEKISSVTAQRKFFSYNDEPSDRESTTEMGIYFVDVGPDGQLCARLEKGRVLPKNPTFNVDKPASSIRSLHTSSYGSKFPLCWWPELKK
ncbi:hypothetical protein AAHA92_09699 [Salvia divinorum]|uniref:Uncharacterized protein n=1 Tax=Salvia divinorum TaxID=28513 RepID=A0ABD1HT10_SALDI